jgi:hypothetical protein
MLEKEGIEIKTCLEKYNKVLDSSIEYKVHDQINKDVERTYGKKNFFKQDSTGYGFF